MKIEIKNRYSENVLFSHDGEKNTLKISLIAALKAGANLYGADLRGANLYGADLYGADLRGADLRGADLYGADLRGANLYGADLRGADLRGADLYGANLYGEKLKQNPIKLTGMQWWVLISDGYMHIGCQRHSHAAWAAFSDAEIKAMGSGARLFWRQWGDVLLAMCKAHADKVAEPKTEQAA